LFRTLFAFAIRLRETAVQMAAPVLVGPQHAPGPAASPTRVRMEARRAGGFPDSVAIDNDRSRGMHCTSLQLARTGCPPAGPGPPTVNGIDKGRPSHGRAASPARRMSGNAAVATTVLSCCSATPTCRSRPRSW
jgi:hypothetical protein